MIRQTSINVYRQIEAEGLLSKRRWEVYNHLYKHGPLTQREAVNQISNKYAAERSYTPRFAELEKMLVIRSVGERVCSITGRQVLIWDVTDKLPKKIETKKEPTKSQLIDKLCRQVECFSKNLLFKDEELAELLELCRKYRKK